MLVVGAWFGVVWDCPLMPRVVAGVVLCLVLRGTAQRLRSQGVRRAAPDVSLPVRLGGA